MGQAVQLHCDGCMKHKHFKSRGNNVDYSASEHRIPLQVFIPNGTRDAMSQEIRGRMNKRDAPKACTGINFNADKGELGCVSRWELLITTF